MKHTINACLLLLSLFYASGVLASSDISFTADLFKYKSKIETVHWGLANDGTGQCSQSDVTLTKRQDRNTALFIREAAGGKGFKTAWLEFSTPDPRTGEKHLFLFYELSGVSVSSYGVNVQVGDKAVLPLESITLKFQEVRGFTQVIKQDGSLGRKVQFEVLFCGEPQR